MTILYTYNQFRDIFTDCKLGIVFKVQLVRSSLKTKHEIHLLDMSNKLWISTRGEIGVIGVAVLNNFPCIIYSFPVSGHLKTS